MTLEDCCHVGRDAVQSVEITCIPTIQSNLPSPLSGQTVQTYQATWRQILEGSSLKCFFLSDRKAKIYKAWLGLEGMIIPYPTAFPYGNGMVLHFYQQQESSTTKTVHKFINKELKTYV